MNLLKVMWMYLKLFSQDTKPTLTDVFLMPLLLTINRFGSLLSTFASICSLVNYLHAKKQNMSKVLLNA